MALFGFNLLDEFEKVNARTRDDFRRFEALFLENMAHLDLIYAEGMELINKRTIDARDLDNVNVGNERIGNGKFEFPKTELCTVLESKISTASVAVAEFSEQPDALVASNEIVKRKSCRASKHSTFVLHCLSKGFQGRRSSLMRIASRASMGLSVKPTLPILGDHADSPAVTGLRTSDLFYTCKAKLSDRFKPNELEATVEVPPGNSSEPEERYFPTVSRFTFSLSDVAASNNLATQPLPCPPVHDGARPKVRILESIEKTESEDRFSSSSATQLPIPKATSQSAPPMKTVKRSNGKKKKTSLKCSTSKQRFFSASNVTRPLTPAQMKIKLDEKLQRSQVKQEMLEAEAKLRLEERIKRREERMKKVKLARLQKEQEQAKKYENDDLKRAMMRIKEGVCKGVKQKAIITMTACDDERYENFLKKKQDEQMQRMRELAEKKRLEDERIMREKLKLALPLKCTSQQLQEKTFVVDESANEFNNSVPPESSVPQSKYVQSKSEEEDYGIQYLHSDDSTDEESRPKKKIPSWASGLAFKRLAIKQASSNVDIDMLFPPAELLVLPDLERIFGMSLPRFRYRTSSAHWSSPMHDYVENLDS